MKSKHIVAITLIALAALLIFIIAVQRNEIAEQARANIELTMRVSKDGIKETLEENGIKLSGEALVALDFVPNTLKLVFTPDENGKNILSEISLNGQKLPHEALSDIGENYLDFSCNLVYN